MRIALDARQIFRPNRRGIGKAILNLYRQLSHIRPDWRVLAYHRCLEPLSLDFRDGVVQPRYIEMPGDRLEAWERLRLPLAAWRDAADVLHCPANSSPPFSPVPVLVTIHDLIPLDFPQFYPPAEVRRFEAAVRNACRHAAWITCPSAWTANQLVQRFQVDPHRLTVIPWAVDASLTPASPQLCQAVRREYGLPGPFVLHFGASDPRKNTPRLLEAWALLPPALRRDWTLVVVGLQPQMVESVQALANHRGITAQVRLAGFASEQQWAALLTAADILAYPSLAEGFGLPILEAFATDTAVLTSNTTSLPEIASDAALLVDPTDSCAIAQGLEKLIADPLYRQQLICRGRLRLKAFSWSVAATRLIDCLEQTAALPARRAAA